MVKQAISNDKLNALPFIKLVTFNPDYDDEAKFSFVDTDGKKYPVSMIAKDGQHHYVFGQWFPPKYRAAALEAVDLLLDEHFVEESRFNEDEEDPTALFIAVESACQDFTLYSDKGREILPMTEV